jgi:predicted phage tail protein
MNRKNRVRHAILTVVIASSIATATGAVRAEGDASTDPSAVQPADDSPPGSDNALPGQTTPPLPEESSTTSPTPPASTESTVAPTPTDAPTTTSAAVPPSTTTPPAAIATTTTTTSPAAIATTTTVAPSNALATVVAFSAATAPLSPVATAGNGSVALTWKAPSSNGGAPVTKYAVQSLVNGQWTNLAYPTGLSHSVSGLSNGTKYYFRIRAINAAGWSPASTTVSAVPLTVPSAPLSPTATPGNGSVTLTWKAPSNNGGGPVTKYAVQRLVNGQWQNMAFPTTGTYKALGLTNGSKYYFRIRAYNAAGWSPVSTTVSAVPRTVPTAPQSVFAVPGNHSVFLSWKAPSSNGGAAVNGYHVYWATSASGPWEYFGTTYSNTYYTASSAYFDNGTPYYFRIVASNAAGWSAPSAVVSAVPRTKPSSPAPCIAFQSSPGSHWMTVTWNAPLSNGGSPIQEYTVEYFENGHYLFSDYFVPAGSFNWDSQQMPYYFNDFEVRVYARNAAGYSPACVVDSIDILP